MNEPTRQTAIQADSKAIQEAITQAAFDAEKEAAAGANPPAGVPVGTGQSAPVGAINPAAVARTLGKLGRLFERSAVKGIYRLAMRASGGDSEFSEGIAADWAWTDGDWDDVDILLAAVVEQYNLQALVRPDIALGLMAVTHAGGYFVLHASLTKRAKELADAKAKPQAAPAAQTTAEN
jgi:hypothetical protein